MHNRHSCVLPEDTYENHSQFNTDNSKAHSQAQLPLPLKEPIETRASTRQKTQAPSPNYGLNVSYGSDGWDNPVAWLVPDYIPGTGVGILFSASMGLKTFVALHLAGCITTDTQFLDKPTRKGLVFYVGAEGATGLPRRLRGFELHNDVSSGKKFVLLPKPLSMADDDQRNALRRVIITESEVQKEDPVLLVLDTFSQCSAGIDENSAGQVAQYLNYCSDLANEFGMAVLIIHHSNKTGGYRGSSTLLANVDFLLETNRVKPLVPVKTQLEVIKSKEGPTGLKVEFELGSIPLGIKDSANRILSTLVVTQTEPLDNDETQRGTKEIDIDVIIDVISNHPSELVMREELLTALAEKLPDINHSTVNKRLSQACVQLVANGIIAEEKSGKNKGYRLKSDGNEPDEPEAKDSNVIDDDIFDF